MSKAETVDAMEWMQRELEADPEMARLVEEEYRRLQLAYTIQVLREDSGLTQAELAARIGTSQPAIARIESGAHTRVSVTTLLKISQALGAKLEIRFKRKRRVTSNNRSTQRVDHG